jgi:hypothetical protein
MFAFDQVAAVEPAARATVQEERQSWAPLYELIEEYCSRADARTPKGIFLGGSMGVNLLLGRPRSLDDFTYYLHSEAALDHCNVLTNMLAELVARLYGRVSDLVEQAREYYAQVEEGKSTKPPVIGDPKIVMMKTMVAHQRYSIQVDGRAFVHFVNLPRGSTSVVEPVLTKSFSGKVQVHVLSPELQLLDLYRTLYSPFRVDAWESAVRDENNLYQHLKKRLPDLIQGNGGSDEMVKQSNDTKNSDGNDLYQHLEERPPNLIQGHGLGVAEIVDGGADKSALELQLLARWIQGNPDVVLIGNHAMHLVMPEHKVDHSAMLQCIVTRPPAELIPAIEQALGKKVTLHQRPLSIMQDFRLERASVRCDDKEVLYMYNSGGYDLIPFNVRIANKSVGTAKGYLQVGNPFVLMRFLLVDLWTVRWLRKQDGKIDAQYAQRRLDSIMRVMLRLRNQLSQTDDKTHTSTLGEKFLTGVDSLLAVFNTDTRQYLGQYVDELQSQKQLIKEGRRFPDYFPDDHLRRQGKYRDLPARDPQNRAKGGDDDAFDME